MFTPTEPNAGFFADINLRIMALRTNPQSGQLAIAEIDAIECLIYQKINEILRISDVFNHPAFGDFQKLDKILKQLFELRMMYPFLYFKEIDEWLIPEGYTDTPESFMHEQFHFFIRHCLDLSELQRAQRLQIHALIVQIMSRPVGQRLIIRLNQMHRGEGKIIKISSDNTDPAPFRMLPVPIDEKKTLPGNFFHHNPYKRFKNFIKHPRVIINYLSNYFFSTKLPVIQKVGLGKTTNFSYIPLHIAFAHELIHSLHYLRGKQRDNMPFGGEHNDGCRVRLLSSFEELQALGTPDAESWGQDDENIKIAILPLEKDGAEKFIIYDRRDGTNVKKFIVGEWLDKLDIQQIPSEIFEGAICINRRNLCATPIDNNVLTKYQGLPEFSTDSRKLISAFLLFLYQTGHDELMVRLFNNVEELWTIELGNLSENKVRAEWHLDPRYSHISAFMAFPYKDRDYVGFKDAPELQAEIQSRLAMQACY